MNDSLALHQIQVRIFDINEPTKSHSHLLYDFFTDEGEVIVVEVEGQEVKILLPAKDTPILTALGTNSTGSYPSTLLIPRLCGGGKQVF